MKNKNILVVSHLYPSPSQKTRGIFVHKQALALRKSGHNVSVISPRVFGKQAAHHYYEIDGIEVFTPAYISFGRFFASFTGLTSSWGVSRVFTKMNFNPDVILAHTALPDGGAVQILSKKIGIPYFVYVHGADVQHKVSYNKLTKRKITNILSGAKKTLVNSSKTQRLVGELGVESVIVPMGVDEINTKRKRQNTKKIKLISVCNLDEEKGIQYVIEALQEINNQNIEYRIIGSGRYEAELKKKAERDGRIKFLGRLSQEKVFSELASSSIFILPSYNEAFGVAYLEAMSFGLPIIGVKGEGVEDILAKGEGGILVEPQNTDSVRLAILRLIGDESLRERMGLEGKKIVKDNYHWDRVVTDLVKELER